MPIVLQECGRLLEYGGLTPSLVGAQHCCGLFFTVRLSIVIPNPVVRLPVVSGRKYGVARTAVRDLLSFE